MSEPMVRIDIWDGAVGDRWRARRHLALNAPDLAAAVRAELARGEQLNLRLLGDGEEPTGDFDLRSKGTA